MSGSMSRSPACSPRAWSCTRPSHRERRMVHPGGNRRWRPTAKPPRHVARQRRAGRDRPDRENVEVEKEYGRSRRDHRNLRRRRGPLVHAVGLAAGAGRRMDRAGRPRRLPLCAAALAANQSSGRHLGIRASGPARRIRCSGFETAQNDASSSGKSFRGNRKAAFQRRGGLHLRTVQRARRGNRRHRRARADDAGLCLGGARNRRHSGAIVPPDDAASRRGMLGRARSPDAGRASALAGRSSAIF